MSEPGPRSLVGSRIAHYEIIARLGAGGMGEVYRARDSNLGRDVAIKVLPESSSTILSGGPGSSARRACSRRSTIRTSAAIYGIESATGVSRARARAGRRARRWQSGSTEGPLPLDEALEDGAADSGSARGGAREGHRPPRSEAGEHHVHARRRREGRRLRPGASSTARGGRFEPVAKSPTLTAAGTVHGIILGTAVYLSPEQARGRAVDKRTDIWAFGCVLFEMLTGRSVFGRETISDTIAAILGQEPDWAALPDDAADRIRALLRRCLDQGSAPPAARYRGRAHRDRGGAGESVIQRQQRSAHRYRDPQTTPPRRLTYVVIGVMGLAACGGSRCWRSRSTGAAFPNPRHRSVSPWRLRARLMFTPTSNLVAFSPDGLWLAFAAANAGGQAAIWIRGIDSLDARLLPGTEGARHPFWSPDSRHIAFFVAGGVVKKVTIDGGAVQVLSPATLGSGTGGTWSRDDVILFSSLHVPIRRISAHGTDSPVLVTDRNEAHRHNNHSFPYFLPDGKRFLFWYKAPAGAHRDLPEGP